MLSSEQVLDQYFLETRCRLLEIAATLDRYDEAERRSGSAPSDGRLEKIYRSLELLADRHAPPGRTQRILELFSDPAG
ncbi:MAG TPA: hypothetical protein EYP56_16135 [Planctomycetaceae bacterium]|nr:hypothetical protein [Planctomycetaceae bacterium]HIQ20021.1 hypothetical protein [Planctomycetota bacterium]